MLPVAALTALAFSSGGGEEGRQGSPTAQSCDAIYLCAFGGCPPGMTLVAPPERSTAYTLRTGDGPDPSNDPTTYVPGELMPLYLRVTRKMIPGKEESGTKIVANETAKYIGLLVYAVASADLNEAKVGGWEVALEGQPIFWTPPDEPGCNGRALMHTDPSRKHVLERFLFRAPPAGTGPITFRALIKQGETNKGAFYWPTAPASATPAQNPVAGRPNGDLMLYESGSPPPRPWSYRGDKGQTCTEVCAAHGLTCDAAALEATDTAGALDEAVVHAFLCEPPIFRTCTDTAPRMSGLGDGLCWYRDASCPAREAPACDAVPSDDFESDLRLCPCTAASGRRLEAEPKAAEPTANQAHEAPPNPTKAASDAPCDDSDDADAAKAPPPGHGAGGNPSRCPQMRAAFSRRALHTEQPRSPPMAVALRFARRLAMPLGAASVLLAGLLLLRRRDGRQRANGAWAAVTLLAGAPGVAPHNWVRTCGSRNNMAASTGPLNPRGPGEQYPHIQVNAGQRFVLEWATGHGGSTYWVGARARPSMLASPCLTSPYAHGGRSSCARRTSGESRPSAGGSGTNTLCKPTAPPNTPRTPCAAAPTRARTAHTFTPTPHNHNHIPTHAPHPRLAGRRRRPPLTTLTTLIT